MTTLREAAQQALEALERSETTVQYEGFGLARRDAELKHQAAITALRAALAAPVQENEALKTDAERYRYLRNRYPPDVLDKTGLEAGAWIDCEDINGTLVLLTGEDADEVIDEERKKA